MGVGGIRWMGHGGVDGWMRLGCGWGRYGWGQVHGVGGVGGVGWMGLGCGWGWEGGHEFE